HALGSPVLRTLSLCTCCRHYPGAAAGRILRSAHPAVSAFPERVVGSACALSFSRIAQRSLALRPAHSRCHQFVTRIPKASAISLPPCFGACPTAETEKPSFSLSVEAPSGIRRQLDPLNHEVGTGNEQRPFVSELNRVSLDTGWSSV